MYIFLMRHLITSATKPTIIIPRRHCVREKNQAFDATPTYIYQGNDPHYINDWPRQVEPSAMEKDSQDPMAYRRISPVGRLREATLPQTTRTAKDATRAEEIYISFEEQVWGRRRRECAKGGGRGGGRGNVR